MAKKYNATALLAHVVSSVGAYTQGESDDFDGSGRTLLESAVRSADAQDVATEVRLVHGEALDQLLFVSADAKADLVVMGTNGRAGLARFYLGSVAEGMLRHSLVPVLVVRAPVAEADR